MCARRSSRPPEALHERAALLRRLRCATIRTAVPPLSRGYGTAYDAIAALAVGYLRRRFGPELAAVYLRGSSVIDFRVPGLSDIDLTIVLRDPVGPERHHQIVDAWRRLSRRVPVLEQQPWTLRVEEFRRLAADNPGVRFRVMEAQRSWRLAHGDDVLAGLVEVAPAERRQALLDDLETRLTYVFGRLFVPRPSDGLEHRRLEYLLYKLVLDLARILHDPGRGPLADRGETRTGFLSGALPVEAALGCGDDERLRAFVAATARRRLRRTWTADAGQAAGLAGSLIDLSIRVLSRCYADPDLLALPGVRDQIHAFYDGGRFLPTGSPIAQLDGGWRDFDALRADVTARLRDGVHTVVDRDGVRIDLANVDPTLGNCTVVPLRSSPPGDVHRGAG